MINTQINTDILNASIAVSLDKITHISIVDANGEYFRKALTDTVEVNTRKRMYTFFISEAEGNTDITEVRLYGDGATATLGTGKLYATQALVMTKTNTQSLLIDWTVELI